MRSLLLLAALTGCIKTEDKPEDTSGIDETTDADADGFTMAEGDCDDADAARFPGAEERCDGVDDDCDGEADNGVTVTVYTDADGDGHGDPASGAPGCDDGGIPATDCDDADATVNPDAAETCDGIDQDCDGDVDDGVLVTWYVDADGDGQGDPTSATEACEPPEGGVTNADDCDDTAADAFVGNTEVCDEIDNDCDGTVDEEVTTTWWVDSDGDGYGEASLTQEACALPTGYADNAEDCDDAAAAVNPAAAETCDGVDDDCDGTVDEADAVDAPTWYDDVDADGWGDPDVATVVCEAPAGTVPVDGDCDDADATLNPETDWYIDYDADTYGNAAYTLEQCEAPAGYVRDAADCDDTDAAVSPAGTETCNGYDDDCDTLVDDDDDSVVGTSTWYADADGDTYGDVVVSSTACEAPAGTVADATDCDDTSAAVYPGAAETWYDGVDSDCDGDDDPSVCDEVPGGTTVAWDDTCAGSYGASWSVVTEWTTDSASYYASGATYDQVMTTPMVGNLTDDDGDGDIDADDTPDVVFTSFYDNDYNSAGYLRVVSGDGAGDLLNVTTITSGGTAYRVSGDGGVALGDLEGDGSPDMVTITTGGDVVALENDGTLKWLYLASFAVSSFPSIADMDGDGLAEVIVGATVLDATGAYVGTCPESSSISFAADVDDDGTQELVMGHALCEMDGTLVWDSGEDAGYPAVGNFDTDDAAEIVVVSSSAGTVTLIDDDGTALWTTSHTGGGGGTPTVADFDGDGEPEIAVAGSTSFAVYEADGTQKWRYTIDDSSSKATGSSAFDFDADGLPEIVYADEHTLFVFDGATGSVLYSNTNHASGTIREYPVVADVDNDGHAEIVLASADYAWAGWAGIHVLGESNGAWASARRVWSQHAYGHGQVGEDLSVPADPLQPWLDVGTYRGQRSWSEAADGAADLEPVLLGGCEDCVNGEVDLYVSIQNTGAVFAPAGATVALYAVDGTTRTLLEEQVTPEVCDPGERLAPLRFTVAELDIGADGLVVVVDEDDVVHECDDTDNEASWDAWTCTP